MTSLEETNVQFVFKILPQLKKQPHNTNNYVHNTWGAHNSVDLETNVYHNLTNAKLLAFFCGLYLCERNKCLICWKYILAVKFIPENDTKPYLSIEIDIKNKITLYQSGGINKKPNSVTY